jgi:hypothetical protein
MRAGTAVERGDLEGWLADSARADEIARRRRLAYVEYVLHFVRFALALLRDDDEAAAVHVEAMRAMRDGLATPALEWNEFGFLYAMATWRPGFAREVAGPMLEFFRQNPFEIGRYPLMHVLVLAGREDDLRAEVARAPLSPLRDLWWMTAEAAVRALVAAELDDRSLARHAVDALRPASGRLAVTGISLVQGPVDGYLAVGLAVLGEREEASRLAERAGTLAEGWGMTAYLRWLREQRDRLGF